VLPPPPDLLDGMLEAIHVFMEWYLLVRNPSLSVSQLEKLNDMGMELMETLK
jgi:hypothetical protein